MFWGVLLSVLALTWSEASADARFAFPEDVAGGRIVSGWEASEGQFPYQLSLRMVNPIGSVFACGASIIHNEWAMTAAHCTANRVTLVIRAGTVNLTRPALIFETNEYYNHPLYIEAIASVVQPHDIGLIKFNRFVEYSDRIKPIRLQASKDRNWNYRDHTLRAAGWGNVWTGGPSPENMNWVFLTGVSNFDCWSAFGGSSIIVDSTICARHYNVTSQSTCQGDSGGVLIAEDYDGGDTIVGVTSFVSSAGCHAGFPAGFIRPGHYHDWFRSVTAINFDWDRQESTPAPETTTTGKPPTETTTEEVSTTTTTIKPPTETTTEEVPTTTTTVKPPTETTTEEVSTTTTTVKPPTETTTEAVVTTTAATEEPESEESAESEESNESESESDSDSSADSNSNSEDEDDTKKHR